MDTSALPTAAVPATTPTIVSGLILGAAGPTFQKLFEHKTFHVHLVPPAEFGDNGFTLAARSKVFLMNTDFELAGPFVVVAYEGQLIAQPQLIHLQRVNPDNIGVLQRSEYANVFTSEEPVTAKAPVPLSASLTSHLALLLERKMRATPLAVVRAARRECRNSVPNSAKTTPNTTPFRPPQPMRAPNSRTSQYSQHSQGPPRAPPSGPRAGTPFGGLPNWIILNPLAFRATNGSATQLLAEVCINTCSPPLRPLEGGQLQPDGSYLHSITLPPFGTIFGTSTQKPLTGMGSAQSPEAATEVAAFKLIEQMVHQGILPAAQFGSNHGYDDNRGRMIALSRETDLLRKNNNQLQSALNELQRHLHDVNLNKDQLALKAISQQETCLTQQQMLKEAYDRINDLKIKLQNQTRRFSTQELLVMRNDAGPLPGNVDTSELPFRAALAATPAPAATPLQPLRDITNGNNSNNSSLEKPDTPGQLVDSACSVPPRENLVADRWIKKAPSPRDYQPSPVRWEKNKAGSYSAKYVEVPARPARSF